MPPGCSVQKDSTEAEFAEHVSPGFAIISAAVDKKPCGRPSQTDAVRPRPVAFPRGGSRKNMRVGGSNVLFKHRIFH